MRTPEEIEKMAIEWSNDYIGEVCKRISKTAFIEAYTRCQQDNADEIKGQIKTIGYMHEEIRKLTEQNTDKKYTYEDLINAFGKGEARGYEEAKCSERYNPVTGYEPKNNKMTFEEYIQSLNKK